MAFLTSRTAAVSSIALLTLVVYWPALNCDFIWDDNAHVTRPDLRSAAGLHRIWFDLGATQQYYPLLHSAFWLEQNVWGEQAWGYHLVNVLEHALSACLVYFVLVRLLIPGAFLAAIIFAVHPVQVESVAWVSEQKNTLSAVFYLSAMLVYLRFDESRKASWYGLASMLFVLGLLTKTVTATLPAALLVIFWWRRGSLLWRRDVWPLLPWFVLGAAAGILTAWVERKLIGAEGAVYELSFIERGLLAGRVIWFYLWNLLWPTNLLFVYPRWNIDASIWWQWLFPLASGAVLIGLWLLRRWDRGPLGCWLLFVGTLFPALGFFNVFPFIYSFVADHFQYLASLGMIVLFAGCVTRLIQRCGQPVRSCVIGMCAFAVAMLAFLCWQQIQVYANNTTLFEHTLRGNPDSWMAHNNLGFDLLGQGEVTGAKKHFEESIRLNPNNPAALVNMGLAAERLGETNDAIHWFEAAIEKQPDYFLAHNALGRTLLMTGRPANAIPQLSQAVRLRPDYAEAYFNLANALAQLGQNPEAIAALETAVRLKPGYPEAQHNLGFLLSSAGNIDEAVKHYREALRWRSNFPEAEFNWANAIAPSRPEEAMQHYQAALHLRPDYAEAFANLAGVFVRLGDKGQAVNAAQQAVALARAQHDEALAKQMEEFIRAQ
jgi:protein O-mannosyl-transferase